MIEVKQASDGQLFDRPTVDGSNVQAVHDSIRGAILTGQLAPSQELSQVQLAKQLGISRTPLREALRLLEREGLVESRPNRSVRVAGFSLEDLDQVYAIRLVLEDAAIRMSIHRLTPEDLAAMEGQMAQMAHFAAAEDYERWGVPHRAFHRTLVRHGGPRFVATLSQLSDYAERYRRLYTTTTPRSWEQGHREHRAILDAVKSGQVDGAALALTQHLARTPMNVIALVDNTFKPRATLEVLTRLTGTPELPAAATPT